MIMAHCEFCTSQHQAEFWRGHYFYAIDASSNDFPGFIRIVAVDHVAEMSALSPEIIKMRRKRAEAMLPKLATALAAISEPQ